MGEPVSEEPKGEIQHTPAAAHRQKPARHRRRKVGAAVAAWLQRRGASVRATSRKPRLAQATLTPGVSPIAFDYDRPETYADDARTAMAAGGLAPDRVERLIRFYGMVRAGACSPVSPDVERVVGRPPAPFAAFARDHASAWC